MFYLSNQIIFFIYFLLLFIYIVFAGLNIYHIVKYGSVDKRSKFLLLLYIFGVVFILSITVIFLMNLDWSVINASKNSLPQNNFNFQ